MNGWCERKMEKKKKKAAIKKNYYYPSKEMDFLIKEFCLTKKDDGVLAGEIFKKFEKLVTGVLNKSKIRISGFTSMDLVSDTTVTMMNHLDKFDPYRESKSFNYFHRFAYNHLLQLLKKMKTDKTLSLDGDIKNEELEEICVKNLANEELIEKNSERIDNLTLVKEIDKIYNIIIDELPNYDKNDIKLILKVLEGIIIEDSIIKLIGNAVIYLIFEITGINEQIIKDIFDKIKENIHEFSLIEGRK